MATTTSTTSTSNTNAITALGAGSGIDVKALAQNLVDAENAPRKNAINASIQKCEARISGYAAVLYAAKELQKAFEDLKDVADFGALAVSNSNTSALQVTSGAGAVAGTHEVQIVSLAQGQRSLSRGFASSTSSLGAASTVSFNLTLAGTTTSLTASTNTPQGVVDAINAAKSTTGVSASLVDTGAAGTPMRIVLSGPTGSDNTFSITNGDATDLAAALGLDNYQTVPADAVISSAMRAASNSQAVVDGLTIVRSSNEMADVIPGLTLSLQATTSSSVSLSLSHDAAPVRTKIETLVTNYNDLQSILDSAVDRESTVENLGGSLFGDSTARTVRDSIRSLVMGDSAVPGNGLAALRQLGVTVDSAGKLQIEDSSKLDETLRTRFDDVVTMFTGNDIIASEGLGDSVADGLNAITTFSGVLQTQSRNASARVVDYKDRLAALETRMARMLEIYNAQFATMDALVGQTRALGTSIGNSFKGMSN